MQPHPTIDQLRLFVAVVEHGSFSAASRELHRSQPVVSYAIASLEAQLGLSLFDRVGRRRPALTDAGKAVLEDARRMLGDLDRLRGRVHAIQEGLEADLALAVSAIVPTDLLVEVLRAFDARFPTVSLHLTVGTLGVVVEALTAGRAALGFGGAMGSASERLVFDPIGQSTSIPVVAPSHPLAALGRPLSALDVRDHTQLVVYDASGLTKGRDFNVFSLRCWRVSDIATKLMLIRGGLGWGGMARSWVSEDLACGRLVPLEFPAFGSGETPIYAIHHGARPPGPAARWLINEVKARFQVRPDSAPRSAAPRQAPRRR